MKKGIETCKSIDGARKPAVPKIWLFTVGENNIFLYASRDDRTLKYFHHIYSTEPITEKVSFLANANDLLELFVGMGKEKELTFEVTGADTDEVEVTNGKKSVPIELFDGKFPIPKLTYSPIDLDEFVEKVKLATDSMGTNIESIGFGGNEIVVRAPIYFKRINFGIDIKPHTFRGEHINLFSTQVKKHWRKSDEKELHIYDDQKTLYVRLSGTAKKEMDSFRQLFVFSDINQTFPPIRNFKAETVHTFEIDSETFFEKVNTYTSDVTDLYLYDRDGKLMIDPYDKRGEELEEDETEPIFELEYKGKMKRTKVSKEALKALLTGYSGEISIDIEEFIEEDDKFHLFSIYTSELYSFCMLKKEPNYVKVQQYLDEIIKEQSKLKYI